MHYSETTGWFYSATTHKGLIPSDAVEITEEYYMALLEGQKTGKVIVPGLSGLPELADPPSATQDELIKRQVLALEAQQTPRRMREATLGLDNGWLADLESQIEALRTQLGAL